MKPMMGVTLRPHRQASSLSGLMALAISVTTALIMYPIPLGGGGGEDGSNQNKLYRKIYLFQYTIAT